MRELSPNPVAWRKILEVGPGVQRIADGPGNACLPGALETIQDPGAVFVDPPRGDYHTKRGYAGRAADVDAIRVALTSPA